MNSVWLAFITGLTTGGFSCLAVQGGLLASTVAAREQNALLQGDTSNNFQNKLMYVSMFLTAKLIAYTLLGFFLGLLGLVLTLSPKAMGLVQIIIGLFMLATSARLLNLHPIFRYFVIQPPKWIYKKMKNTSKNNSFLAPASLGFLTVLIPCGVTQAMMAVAVGIGNPWAGAAIMFAFVLGTSPIFFALGAAITELMERKAFRFAAAGVVIIFGILSINGGLGLQGSIYTLQNFYKAATTDTSVLALGNAGNVANIANGVQDVTIRVYGNGYEASADTLKVGIPVRIKLLTNRTQGCARAFTLPEYNISKILPATGTEYVEFTPTKTGRLAFSCSMGMYTGAFTVVP